MLTIPITHILPERDNNLVSGISRLWLAASRKVLARSAIAVLLAATPASISAQAIVTELKAMKSVTETTANGDEIETLVPVTTILPGERVCYTLSYSNQSDALVTSVVISLPIPKDMTFLPGSADQTGTSVTYSVDEGTTFDLLERLTITNADGLERPARAADVTAIRWTVAGALEPQQSGAVSCIAAID
ncbi:MAG: hypothetical protein O7C75_20570 [Verrucomicrobia bacterium]|nr:hypothetical protein [Verrucomicrobiota bacterium]